MEGEAPQPQIRSLDDVSADNRRGGDIRTLLSPKAVGAKGAYMGVATIGPGDWIAEHYHPYSDEFLYVVKGSVTARLDGEDREAREGQAVFIPINCKHRLTNDGSEEAQLVFIAAPLAPRPDMGHVDTEQRWEAGAETPAANPS
jgi:putative monooxygenase